MDAPPKSSPDVGLTIENARPPNSDQERKNPLPTSALRPARSARKKDAAAPSPESHDAVNAVATPTLPLFDLFDPDVILPVPDEEDAEKQAKKTCRHPFSDAVNAAVPTTPPLTVLIDPGDFPSGLRRRRCGRAGEENLAGRYCRRVSVHTPAPSETSRQRRRRRPRCFRRPQTLPPTPIRLRRCNSSRPRRRRSRQRRFRRRRRLYVAQSLRVVRRGPFFPSPTTALRSTRRESGGSLYGTRTYRVESYTSPIVGHFYRCRTLPSMSPLPVHWRSRRRRCRLQRSYFAGTFRPRRRGPLCSFPTMNRNSARRGNDGLEVGSSDIASR